MTTEALNAFAFVDALPQTIETKRLRLRAPNRSDVPALARLANSEAIYKWLARLPHPYTTQDAIEFIDNLARTTSEHAFAFTSREDDFIGVGGFHLLEDGTTELGYWLGEPYWGEGYASECVQALVKAAFQAGCPELFARVQTANVASCRVLEKCGFSKTNERVDDCGPHQGVSISFFCLERT